MFAYKYRFYPENISKYYCIIWIYILYLHHKQFNNITNIQKKCVGDT